MLKVEVIDMSLGERIQLQRKRRGFSQEKLADLVGVSRQAVTKWEAGQSAPSTENLFRLAQVLGTTVDLLLTQEDAPAPPPAESLSLIHICSSLKIATSISCAAAARESS